MYSNGGLRWSVSHCRYEGTYNLLAECVSCWGCVESFWRFSIHILRVLC